jgi:hypothetical protein
MTSAAHLWMDPDGKGQSLGISVSPPAYYGAADAGSMGTFRAAASSAALRPNPFGTTRLYLFERGDLSGRFLRLTGGEQPVQANLAQFGWDDRAQSVACIATTHSQRSERSQSFRDLFLDRWRATIKAEVDRELRRTTSTWQTTLDMDTSMSWDLAVDPRPDPREAYVRIRQGLTILTGAGENKARVDYLIRLTTSHGGGTPSGSPVLPWTIAIEGGPEPTQIMGLLETVEPSVAAAVREQLDVSFRAIFGSHRDSTMQFRAFGIYVLPHGPAVDEEPVAEGDSDTDVTIMLALQPLPAATPPGQGPEEPQPIDAGGFDAATDLTMSKHSSRIRPTEYQKRKG